MKLEKGQVLFLTPYDNLHNFLKKLNILTGSSFWRDLVPLFHCRDCKTPSSLCFTRVFRASQGKSSMPRMSRRNVTNVSVLDRYLGHWPLMQLNTKHKLLTLISSFAILIVYRFVAKHGKRRMDF